MYLGTSVHIHVHVIGNIKWNIHYVIGGVERKKERHLRQWKMKLRVALSGIQTHDTLYSRQMSTN